MNKGSMSILRAYCLFNEMRVYSKIYSESIKDVQVIIRQIDNKSNYTFPLIEPPVIEEKEKENKEVKKSDDLAAQPS